MKTVRLKKIVARHCSSLKKDIFVDKCVGLVLIFLISTGIWFLIYHLLTS